MEPEPEPEIPAAPVPSVARARLARLLRFVPLVVALGLATAAFFVLHRALREHTFAELRHAVHSLPPRSLLRAALLTALSYFVLTGYDALALTTLKIKLPYRRTVLASFLGYVFSNNLGLSVLGGGAARWRVYSGFGLSTFDIAKVVAICAATFWLGILALAGGVLAFAPALVVGNLQFTGLVVPEWSARLVGALLLATAASYVVLCKLRRTPLKWRQYEIALPTPAIALTQVLLSVADWCVAAAVLWALLPADPELTYPRLLGVFLSAQIVAVASHVPGGLGIFEVLVLALLKEDHPTPELLGALLAYRGLYYLVPLAIGTIVFAVHELHRRLSGVERVSNFVARVAPALVPRALAFSTFWAGAILIVSGALPTAGGRVRWLAAAVPLSLIEASHFLASVVGVALLVLARGLHQRIRFAWGATAVLLAAGALMSLVKGLGWEEATLLSVLLAAHLPCRRHFTRHSSLLHAPLGVRWFIAVAVVLGSATWLGFFAFRHVEYSNDLWWRFEVDSDAPRMLRSLTGAAIFGFAYALSRLLKPAQPVPPPADAASLERALPLIRRAPDSLARLALVGDKSLLFAEPDAKTKGERAFLMFAVQGRSWVALGDPIGDPDAGDELGWRFHEMVHEHGGRTVFYQVLADHLPLYLELGLRLLKLGEEARVPLKEFELRGRARRNLRRSCEKVEEAGGTFELIKAVDVPAVTAELARVSEEWLAARATREKGFSIGRFDPAYLARGPVAVVRREQRIVAFANVWASEEAEASREELSIDLMRSATDAPDGAMDFLVTRLIEWGRAHDYAWFNLGMAPLAGLEARPLATAWSRVAAALFRHGESLYNFQGVRQWKSKFDPVWRARYLATPGGLSLPSVLRDVTALVAGGVRGVFKK
jgi:phosphatidylglycerol lysyltransferase